MNPTIIALVTVLLVCCNLNGTCKNMEENTISPQQQDIFPPYKVLRIKNRGYIDPQPTDWDAEYRKNGYFSIFGVDITPLFPGGWKKCRKFINKTTKYPYPPSAKIKREGKVAVKFIVKEDGSIINAQVINSVDPLLDEEAIRVIYTMPRWEPGKRNGYPVNVAMILPITFKMPTP